MPRARRKRRSSIPPQVPADPALLRVDLKEWAGQQIAAAGRKDALLGRVELLCVGLDGRSLEARVRGNRPLPYRVEITIRDDTLHARCTCSEATAACRHAVAVLEGLRFPLQALPKPDQKRPAGRPGRGRGRIVQRARLAPGFVVFGDADRTLTREERISLARGDELSTIRQRARRDKADVEIVPGRGLPRLRIGGGKSGPVQTVTVRAERAALASCTCEDWIENELLTCRHIERARSFLRRSKVAVPQDLAVVWWQPRIWTEQAPEPLRELRLAFPLDEWPRSLRRYFNEEGWLLPAPDGESDAAHAQAAVKTARRVTARRKVGFDLDPAVAARIDQAAIDEARAARLSGAAPDLPEWLEIRDQLGFRLHPYQEQGALFLARGGRAFLADDMGLGKTIQAIAAALLLRTMVAADRTLVVCPASLKHQWRREIDKAYGEKAVVVEGTRAQRMTAYANWKHGFLIVNYELVLRDLESIREIGADIVLLDEAQRIKNWNTKTAKAVKQLDSPYAFVLTGTPLENRLPELHSIVEFLHPRALGPRWRLAPFHAVTEAGGRVVAYEGLDLLRRRLRGFLLRRERKTVLDQLPSRTDNTFWTDMTPAQRAVYRKLAVQLATLVSGPQPLRSQDVRSLLRALTGMRILCNGLAQYEWSAHADRLRNPAPPTPGEVKALNAPKLEEFARVLEDVLDESPSKVVVFSQWLRMLRLAQFVVRQQLHTRDARAEMFHGSLSSQQREHVLEVFRSDPEVRVLFATDAGGLGLNLQESASIVINLDVPWNPAVLEQRVGRVHRIGQRRSVQVLNFVARGVLEERVRQVLENKRALFDGLLVDEKDTVIFAETRPSTFMERIRLLVE